MELLTVEGELLARRSKPPIRPSSSGIAALVELFGDPHHGEQQAQSLVTRLPRDLDRVVPVTGSITLVGAARILPGGVEAGTS
jgi:hypothetical protein